MNVVFVTDVLLPVSMGLTFDQLADIVIMHPDVIQVSQSEY